ncbi:helix-turn-helix domain-containing protein [uncultured Alistipes sp.]
MTKTALRCGIARSTLYRWIKRHKEYGENGLSDVSTSTTPCQHEGYA